MNSKSRALDEFTTDYDSLTLRYNALQHQQEQLLIDATTPSLETSQVLFFPNHRYYLLLLHVSSCTFLGARAVSEDYT